MGLGVVVIHQVGCRGGAGTTLANMVEALVCRRHRVTVVCPAGDMVAEFERRGAVFVEAPRQPPQVPHYTGLEYRAADPRFVLAVGRLLRDYPFWRRWFRETGGDVVQLNALTLAPLLFAGLAGHAAVLGVVQETAVHGWLGLRTALLRRLLSRMDGVMFISDFERRTARCSAPIVEAIPNWVDLRVFDRRVDRGAARAALGVPAAARVVLMMGGISRLKGTLTLIEAVACIRDIDGLIVCIAGDRTPPPAATSAARRAWRRVRHLRGDYHRQVADAVASERLERHVRFVGMQQDVVSLYAASDVVVFPASRPHQARPVLEAGAMAKPVVVPDFPQVAEFVTDGHNGLCFEPNDPTSLAAALRALLEEPERARALGENNYRVATTRHDGSVNASRYADLVERVAARRVGAR